MRNGVILVLLALLAVVGMTTGCGGTGEIQEEKTMTDERTVPEIDMETHEKVATATFAMG